MDKIIVRTNTDMQRVIDWSEKLSGMAIELPFKEAEIQFHDELILLRFRDEGSPVVFFEMFFERENADPALIATWRCDLSDGKIENLRVNADDHMKRAQMSMILVRDNTIWKCVEKFKALMLFAAYYRDDIERTKVVQRSTVVNSRATKKKSGGKKMLTVRRYTINNSMLSELPEPKKGWHGYKESFGVRGHFRKTKTGKVIWVRPYQKLGIVEKKTDQEYVL